MKRTSALYRAVVRIAVPLVPIFVRGDRQRAAHRARLAAPGQLERWAREHRDPNRPLAWFHAPSVGEGLQARAVIAAFRSLRPELQIVYTHYSPSAEAFARTIGAEWSGYLCYDRGADVEQMLNAAAPDLFVFTKADLWPELSLRAHERGARVAMVAATVEPRSTRLRWLSRTTTREAYAALDAVAAVSNDDADRLVRLGCGRERITVCGDPRIDSVLDAVDATPAVAPGPNAHLQSTFVAGSTWPADERVVLEAFGAVRQSHPGARLIVVPHQPTIDHLTGVESRAARLGLPLPVRSSRLAAADAAIVLIDELGKLAQLYALGIAAYVGGGFGRRGIHSVLEPAAWSRPVVIGPRDRGNRDARLLERAGALVRLSERGAVAELARAWRGWLHNASNARRDGEAARAALERERGAAMRSAAVLDGLLDHSLLLRS